MSGIYIHGIEMPTDNTVLLRIYPEIDGVIYVEQLDIDDDILDKYWAVPVPPHGRLIDGDKLIDELPKNLGIRGLEYLNRQESAIVSWIHAAPTIIPADKEGEG